MADCSRRGILAGAAAFLAAGGCRSLSFGESPAEREVRRQIAAGYYSCACCGAVGGERFAMGDRRPEDATPVAVDGQSLFEVASVSKTFTALIAAQLHCAGLLDIDAPFTRYLPRHALAKTGTDITLRDIAAHAAGFSDGWFYRDARQARRYQSADGLEAGALAQLPEGPRRMHVKYACHDMILLGYAIEQVTGLDLDAAARKYVWGPLGMASTGWRNCPENPHTVQMYTHGPVPLGYKGDEKARASASRPIGNAGVFTSLDDMMKYAEDLLCRRTFPEACYDLLFTPTFGDGKRRRSFGWDMSPGMNPPGWSAAAINHSGYTGQYVAVDPEQGHAVVILTNLRLTAPAERARAYEDRRVLATLMR